MNLDLHDTWQRTCHSITSKSLSLHKDQLVLQLLKRFILKAGERSIGSIAYRVLVSK